MQSLQIYQLRKSQPHAQEDDKSHSYRADCNGHLAHLQRFLAVTMTGEPEDKPHACRALASSHWQQAAMTPTLSAAIQCPASCALDMQPLLCDQRRNQGCQSLGQTAVAQSSHIAPQILAPPLRACHGQTAQLVSTMPSLSFQQLQDAYHPIHRLQHPRVSYYQKQLPHHRMRCPTTQSTFQGQRTWGQMLMRYASEHFHDTQPATPS